MPMIRKGQLGNIKDEDSSATSQFYSLAFRSVSAPWPCLTSSRFCDRTHAMGIAKLELFDRPDAGQSTDRWLARKRTAGLGWAGLVVRTASASNGWCAALAVPLGPPPELRPNRISPAGRRGPRRPAVIQRPRIMPRPGRTSRCA